MKYDSSDIPVTEDEHPSRRVDTHPDTQKIENGAMWDKFTSITIAVTLLGMISLGFIVSSMQGQVGVPNYQKPTQFNYVVQTRPGAIPTSPTDVTRVDSYLCSGWVGGTGQTITIQDRQGTPIAPFNAVAGTSGAQSTTFFPFYDDSRCIWFPNGITWSANATGATGYLTIKCQTPCPVLSSVP